MKKIIYICCVALMTLFTSCDKDASNVELIKMTGTYVGDIGAALYMPDYNVEEFNIEHHKSPALAVDSIPMGQVQINFSSSDKAIFQMDKLMKLKFKVLFSAYLYDDEDDRVYYAYDGIYEKGVLGKLFQAVSNKYEEKIEAATDAAERKAINDTFIEFAKLSEYLEDTIQISNLHSNALNMREFGALYSTYDTEQNSLYERINLEPFDIERSSNISAILKFVEQNYPDCFTPEIVNEMNTLRSKIVMKGTIKDASGWCSVSYSNYRPEIYLSISKATGLLDVLTTALYGEKAVNSLWFMISYTGRLEDVYNWEEKKE